jgi:hypothetical protein
MILGNTRIVVEEISSKSVLPKKRGRPATGKDPMLSFRASPALIARVEAWAGRQPDKPSRSEALRRLITRILNVADFEP